MLRYDLLLPFAVAFVLITGWTLIKGERTPIKDELSYLQIARDLTEKQTFTDGSFSKPGFESAPGRFMAPAYPVFVHLLSQLDPHLAKAVACHAEDPKHTRSFCGGRFYSLMLIQAVLIAFAAACIFAMALILTRSRPTAWLTLGLALAAGEFRDFPRFMLTENLAFPAFIGFLACAVAWSERREDTILAAMAGALIALAALARPSYVYLIYAISLGLVVFAFWPQSGNRGDKLKSAVAFVVTAALVLTPWMIRNYALFGDTSLTAGYGAFTLAQRVAYNAMTWKEWLIAWIYWLPDFGDNLIKSVLPKSDYVRLGWTDPSSFYHTGAGKVFSETLAAAGSSEAHLSYLLRHHVLGDLVKHVGVTLPLTWRGIWAGGYLALAGVLIAPIFVRRIVADRKPAPLVALSLPLLFMAGLHGFVSVNIVRYNEAMIALFATIVAWALAEAWRRYSSKYKEGFITS